MSPRVRLTALITIMIAVSAVIASATVHALGQGTGDSLTLTYDVRVTFLMAANMGEPDHASAEGEGTVSVDIVPSGDSVTANFSSKVRVRIDYEDLLDLFSQLNRTWSKELGPGRLIVLNETGMNAFLKKVVKQVRPGLIIERNAHLGRWGDRPALELRVRVYNNESRPEYLMLYRVSINGTYYYDLSTGYLLESSVEYWVITSQGPMQVYMNGSANYRLSDPEELPEPGKAKTYWFRIGYDLGKVVVTWEGGEAPRAELENGKIVIKGGGSRVMSVTILSPYEPTIELVDGEIEPVTHPLSPPWGSFTIATVGGDELRIGFGEGVDEVSESPPGEGIPWYVIAGAGAAAAAVAATLIAKKRRG